jgi:hypothetical protein
MEQLTDDGAWSPSRSCRTANSKVNRPHEMPYQGSTKFATIDQVGNGRISLKRSAPKSQYAHAD